MSLRDERLDDHERGGPPQRGATMDERLRLHMGGRPAGPDPRSKVRFDEDLFGADDDEPRHALGGRR